MQDVRVPISEIFGPTLQGEGVSIGRRAVFVRVAGCDSACEWCDTKYARDSANGKMMTAQEIADDVGSRIGHGGLVVLTGGNPALYDLSELCYLLKRSGKHIHMETQGTIIPYWLDRVDLVTICPKVRSGEDIPEIVKKIWLAADLVGAVVLKYVVFTEQDYEDARAIAENFPSMTMVIQPGYDCEKKEYPYGFTCLAERVAADGHMQRSVRFLPQLHRLLWGDRRGV